MEEKKVLGLPVLVPMKPSDLCSLEEIDQVKNL